MSGASTSGAKPRGPREKGDAAAAGPDAVVELTWQKQCANCHGPFGRGDGPQGAMFKAPDLTRADWQAATTDDAIATTIRNGKGAMPKFDLTPEVVSGLVARIRLAGGAKPK